MSQSNNSQILPGVGVGKLRLGDSEQVVLDIFGEPLEKIVKPSGVALLSYGEIQVWLDKRGLVMQIGLLNGYEGRTSDGIHIGLSKVDLTKLWGFDYGSVSLWNGSDGVGRVGINAGGNGGDFSLLDNTASTIIHLNAGQSGDNAAIFPDDAINSDEILDEPGIANNDMIGYVTLATTMDDLQSLTIEIPAPGYIS